MCTGHSFRDLASLDTYPIAESSLMRRPSGSHVAKPEQAGNRVYKPSCKPRRQRFCNPLNLLEAWPRIELGYADLQALAVCRKATA